MSYSGSKHTSLETAYYKEFSSQTKPKIPFGGILSGYPGIKSVFTFGAVLFENFRNKLNSKAVK